MKHYGDLEKFLGNKYARELNDGEKLAAVYDESRQILNSELDAMAMLNQAFLAVQGLKQRRQQGNAPA